MFPSILTKLRWITQQNSQYLEFDKTLLGFKDHVETVSVGLTGVIERSIKEGISIVIEGVHIVPGFIDEELLNTPNVYMFVLAYGKGYNAKKIFLCVFCWWDMTIVFLRLPKFTWKAVSSLLQAWLRYSLAVLESCP